MGTTKKLKRAAHREHEATGKAARARDHPVVDALGRASEVADQPPLIALSAVTLAAGLVLRRPALARTGARMLASHLLATGIKTIVKRSVDRTRPSRALSGGHRVAKGEGDGDTMLNSFPSGHTAGAVAVAEAVARGSPAAAGPARAAAAAVGAMQLPRGAHYLTDVAVGAAIGWLSERIVAAGFHGVEHAIARRRAAADAAHALAETEAHPS